MSALVEMSAPVITAFIASGGLVSGWAWWFDHREKARLKEAAAKDLERDHQRKLDGKWFEEAAQAYQRVDRECRECREELRESEARRLKEISYMKQELADIKEALVTRIDAFEELLPHVNGLTPEKISELRAVNRAQRAAVFRQGRD